MTTDYLLLGQGIAGSFLQHYLEKAGFSTMVIDVANENSPSKVASGIINPVTGRRLVTTWKIDEVLPFALKAYKELENKLDITAIRPKNIVEFFTTPQMRLAFQNRFSEDATYLEQPDNENSWLPSFNYELGAGIIKPCYLIDLRTIVRAQIERLKKLHLLREEKFELEHLKIKEIGVQYGDLHAKKIIFCDGSASFQNPYFKMLPFAPNKGEALWVEIEDLPDTHIFKKGINLVPWDKNIYWVGSTYEWDFKHENPTIEFQDKMTTLLKNWIKQPFKVLDHRASVRPATLERRPFVGFHPQYPQIGIFNGMGTKGCSLAPFLAQELTENQLQQTPINPEADLMRFRNIITRNLS